VYINVTLFITLIIISSIGNLAKMSNSYFS